MLIDQRCQYNKKYAYIEYRKLNAILKIQIYIRQFERKHAMSFKDLSKIDAPTTVKSAGNAKAEPVTGKTPTESVPATKKS
jgi:hypothetical protein